MDMFINTFSKLKEWVYGPKNNQLKYLALDVLIKEEKFTYLIRSTIFLFFSFFFVFYFLGNFFTS